MLVISQSLQIKHNKVCVFLLVLQDFSTPAPDMVLNILFFKDGVVMIIIKYLYPSIQNNKNHYHVTQSLYTSFSFNPWFYLYRVGQKLEGQQQCRR